MTVLAMIANNALRLIAWQNELDAKSRDGQAPDGAGTGVLLFRLQAALLSEATAFIGDAQHWFPEIKAFVAGPSVDCRERLASLNSFSTTALEQWMRQHRHITFHYPELHPDKAAAGKEEITLALANAAELDGTISFGDGHHSVRYGFADEVVVQWLPDADVLSTTLEEIAMHVITLVHVVELLMRSYLEQRGDVLSAG
jgi:hypothetical protein